MDLSYDVKTKRAREVNGAIPVISLGFGSALVIGGSLGEYQALGFVDIDHDGEHGKDVIGELKSRSPHVLIRFKDAEAIKRLRADLDELLSEVQPKQ